MSGTTGIGRGLRALARCVALLALLPVQLVVLAAEFVAWIALMCGQFYVWPAAVEGVRWLPTLRRGLAARYAGVTIPVPYLPPPAPLTPGPDGLYRSPDGRRLYPNPRFPQWQVRSRWAWRDPATWRDLLWLLLDPILGAPLVLLPPALVACGLLDAALPLVAPLPRAGIAVVGVVAGVLLAPVALAGHAHWTALLLRRSARPAVEGRWGGTIIRDLITSARFAGLSLGSALMFVAQVAALALTGPVLAVPVVRHGRAVPDAVRCLIAEATGREVDAPYHPAPARTGTLRARLLRDWRWLLADPATWRDLLWLGLQPLVGIVLTLVPLLVFGYGWWGLALPGLESVVGLGNHPTDGYGAIDGSAPLAVAVGLVLVALACGALPVLLRGQCHFAELLLRPTGGARLLIEREELTRRVATLTESRSAVVDTQASEVRRIERDLHDGAQARLVAMGMTLGAVEALIDHDPAAAKKLLAQARESSRTALQELRDLVRGIHPPVLAERGLPDAIHALALDNPLTVVVNARLPGRAEAPVESAAYFAVAEALANATKHAGAGKVWIDLRHEDGRLRITVLDDGHGGADARRGSGLRGIERRLGSFDGNCTLSSPLGGPTMVAMEVPCVLSSPRTSTSSGTA